MEDLLKICEKKYKEGNLMRAVTFIKANQK